MRHITLVVIVSVQCNFIFPHRSNLLYLSAFSGNSFFLAVHIGKNSCVLVNSSFWPVILSVMWRVQCTFILVNGHIGWYWVCSMVSHSFFASLFASYIPKQCKFLPSEISPWLLLGKISVSLIFGVNFCVNLILVVIGRFLWRFIHFNQSYWLFLRAFNLNSCFWNDLFYCYLHVHCKYILSDRSHWLLLIEFSVNSFFLKFLIGCFFETSV